VNRGIACVLFITVLLPRYAIMQCALCPCSYFVTLNLATHWCTVLIKMAKHHIKF